MKLDVSAPLHVNPVSNWQGAETSGDRPTWRTLEVLPAHRFKTLGELSYRSEAVNLTRSVYTLK